MRKLRLCLIAALLVLAACGSGDDGEPAAGAGDDPDEEQSPDDQDGGDQNGEDEAGEPVAGGTLTYGIYAESTGYDPIKRSTTYANPAIYDSLMRFDDEGNVEPYMAESMETEDNITWTMTLREGINFHDGTPLDAEAVIFSIERHLDPDNASGAFALAEPIESMEAIDDLTIEFTLSRPFAPFAASFAQANGIGLIPSPTAVEELGDDFNLNPVGAGPFKFVEWIPDDRLVLEKNEDYWQEGLPYLDEMIYRPIADTQTRQQAILNGDVDLTYMITAREILDAQEQGNLQVLSEQANGGEGIVLNDNRPPFDDPRIREAFVASLNLDVIADVRLGGQRDWAGTVGLIAPDSPVYNETKHDVWPDFDPDRARSLIEDYESEGNDASFTFVLPNTPDRRAFAEMAGQFFRDVDWDVEMEFLDISEFVTGILQTGDFEAAIMSYPAFIGEYPQMWNAYHSTGLSNWAHFEDAEVDAALERAVSATDEAAQVEAWKEVQVLVAEKIPFATYGRPPSALITQDDVHGVDKYPDNTLWPATLWIEQ